MKYPQPTTTINWDQPLDDVIADLEKSFPAKPEEEEPKTFEEYLEAGGIDMPTAEEAIISMYELDYPRLYWCSDCQEATVGHPICPFCDENIDDWEGE